MRGGTRKVADSKPDNPSTSQQDGEDSIALRDLGKFSYLRLLILFFTF